MPSEHNWQVPPIEVYRTEDASRHLGGAALPGVNDPWKCPRCGVENQTPLPQGCPVCGSGKPGMRAPVPSATVVFREGPVGYRDPAGVFHPTGLAPQNASQPAQEPIPAPIGREADLQAYYAWGARQEGSLAFQQVWLAGVEYGRQTVRLATTASEPAPMPDLPPVPPAEEGTAESRTLVAALELFIEQVLQHSPEEVTSGEWLTAQAARDLIERIQRGELA